MRRILISVAAALLVMGASAVSAQKVDFNGIWALDKSRSEGAAARPGAEPATFNRELSSQTLYTDSLDCTAAI
jgi:hypothetical protein